MTRTPTASSQLTALRTVLTDAFHGHRRVAVALLAAAALVLCVNAIRPGRQDTVAVWVAARDLGGAAPLHRHDLTRVWLPHAAVPAGAIVSRTPPVGAMLGAPVRRGEPLTDVRLLSPFLLAATASAHDVAVPVRVSDGPAALALVRAGERITVIAAGDSGLGTRGSARTVLRSVRVLAVPNHATDDGFGLIVIAATPHQATALARVPPSDRISVAVRR